ncbi:matrixin family metalloprotease [Aeoliella sp.]|uniref:matrixin family metalloprotease n=1 Tax=Aeoliella sp. TaxID=2795800 RepID=UPI003CCBD2A3
MGTDDPDSLPVANYGTTRPGWPQDNPGDPVYLTYSYQNMFDGGLLDPDGNPVPESQIRTAIEEAFSVWAEVAPLHFTEVPDDGLNYGQSTAHGTIRFRHVYINGPDPPTGNPTTKAQARFPGSSSFSGDVDFDHGDPWALIGTTREPDILGAAIHEVGHALGLTHTNIQTANMYWIFKRHTGPGSGELHPDDIAGIQSIYGAGVGSVTPIVQIPEPSTALLAAVALVAVLTWRSRS